ncbi:hypothetical protein RhiLY_05952 [Ceratobasidium sp. AG-Ba]|nr:hypothetical protein RhiLY_05952 [Ceratobasidium sp. AG-Ba]
MLAGNAFRMNHIDAVTMDSVNGKAKAYLLAAVRECDTDGSDAVNPETPVVTYNELGPINLVHIDTIISVVGRIQLGQTWAIVDRSRDNARPQFDDDYDDDDDNGDN